MSQDFKLRYEQLHANDPTKAENLSDATGGTSFYETPGHSRNLCLVWPDGRRMFLNYAYLVSGEFTLEGDENIMILSYSLNNVILKGYMLEALFTTLMDQLVRQITVADPRYDSCQEGVMIVTAISTSRNEE